MNYFRKWQSVADFVTEANALGFPTAYSGSAPQFLMIPGVSVCRDSEPITEANFEAFRESLSDLEQSLPQYSDSQPLFCLERFRSWAVGWVEYLTINPDCPEARSLCESLLDRLEQHPVLDEDLLYALEAEAAAESAWLDDVTDSDSEDLGSVPYGC